MAYIEGNNLVLSAATMGPPAGTSPLYSLRAGAKGAGTTRNAALNVSSVTRIDQGRYRLNLSSATSTNSFGACSADHDRSLMCNCRYDTTSRFVFSFRGTNDARYDENGSWGVVVAR